MTQQGMSTKSRHLTIPDLITIGVFTALYFVLVAVATLFSSVALMGFGMILLPAVAALICGCVYMLLVAKVGKFGAISVMGIVADCSCSYPDISSFPLLRASCFRSSLMPSLAPGTIGARQVSWRVMSCSAMG